MIIELLFTSVGHFILNVFVAFVFFVCGWLYLDSTNINKNIWMPKSKSIGFFLLAIISLFHSISIDWYWTGTIEHCLKIIGIYLILIGLIFEPSAEKPNGIKKMMILVTPTIAINFLSTVLYLLISLIYFLKSTKGLEKQLRLASWGFLVLTISEFAKMINEWTVTDSVYWSKILAEYGLVSMVQHGLEITAAIILGFWVLKYLNFRHHLQLFISLVASTLAIFITTTLFFCFLLTKNLENNVFANLQTNAKVLEYLVERLKNETLNDAKRLETDENFKKAILNNNRKQMYDLATGLMISENISSVTVTNEMGEVMMRTENEEKYNDIIKDEQTIKMALKGKRSVSILINESLNFPTVEIIASVPVYQQKKIIGSITIKLPIDNAFVDGIKKITGLEITVFAKNIRSATTFFASDGISRSIGTIETDEKIIQSVLENGKIYTGSNNVLNQPFYSIYLPIKNFDNKTIGMFYVGEIKTAILETAKKSIQLTFLGSALLIIVSILPIYLVSGYIKDQMEA